MGQGQTLPKVRMQSRRWLGGASLKSGQGETLSAALMPFHDVRGSGVITPSAMERVHAVSSVPSTH